MTMAEQTRYYQVGDRLFTTKSRVTRYLHNVRPRHTLTSINIRVRRFDLENSVLGWVSALDWLCNDREPREWRASDELYVEITF